MAQDPIVDEAGEWTATGALTAPTQDWLDQRDPPPADDPAAAELETKLAVLGAALLADPAQLDQLVANVAASNTAKGPLQYVNTAVQTAADA